MIDHAAMMLFLMFAGHAYIDFGVQSAWQSQAKRPGNSTGIPWPVGLGMHSLMHGGVVTLATGVWWLGAAETMAHGLIDFGKGRKWYGAITDQVFHITCKIIWMTIAINA